MSTKRPIKRVYEMRRLGAICALSLMLGALGLSCGGPARDPLPTGMQQDEPASLESLRDVFDAIGQSLDRAIGAWQEAEKAAIELALYTGDTYCLLNSGICEGLIFAERIANGARNIKGEQPSAQIPSEITRAFCDDEEKNCIAASRCKVVLDYVDQAMSASDCLGRLCEAKSLREKPSPDMDQLLSSVYAEASARGQAGGAGAEAFTDLSFNPDLGRCVSSGLWRLGPDRQDPMLSGAERAALLKILADEAHELSGGESG